MSLRMVKLIAGAIGLVLFGLNGRTQEAQIPPPAPSGLTLQETLEKVLVHNESLQAKMLEAEIARHQYKAERGIFEPAIVGSFEHIDSIRENTTEQRAALGIFGAGRREYGERNDLWNGGLEFLTPIGSRFRVGYNLRRLHNSLTFSETNGVGFGEYVTTIGATITQPLLKNAGLAATMARIRLAAINSDMAFQDYRRQLMLTLSRAEAAYWDLYFSQEQDRISGESVQLADSIYADNKARLEVGKSSELEVLQAEAGLALRQSRRSEAGQRLSEAATQLSTLFSGSTMDAYITTRASEEPQLRDVPLDYYESYKDAFENNPDYLTRRYQAVAENIRLAFSKNQLLPQLDLKGSYGLNGLGVTPGESHDDLERARYPAWTIGVEMRIPVTGGMRERNEYKAARLSKQRALVNLKEIEVQIGNALSTAILKVSNLRQSVENHRSVISFHQQLLETQLARLEVGVIDSRTVLETEEKLFEARMSLLENLVAYQKALLELELVKGTTLGNRQLELTKAELQEMTQRLIEANRFGGPAYESLRAEIQQEYRKKIKNLDANEKRQGMMQAIFD